MTRPVLWVLVHDLERTGVPVALARMAAWQAAGPGGPVLDVHVVAERTGPLRSLLAQTGSVTTLEPRVGRSRAATAAVGLAEAGAPEAGAAVRRRAWRHRVRALPAPDVVLVHGAGAWRAWDALAPAVPAATRVVAHLHELESALARCVPEAEVAPFLGRADRVLAVCEPVAELARRHGVAADRVAIVPGAVELRGPHRAAGASVVLGIGMAGWRKGTDRFVAVAHELRRSRPDATCRWVGGEPVGPGAWARGSDLAVEWCPSVPDPWARQPDAAVLLLTSREDPLPLVVLEAGARSIPVVAAATGGLPALLADGRGWVVAGDDLAGLAAAVAETLDGGAAVEDRAAALRAHVAEHHDVSVVGPRWLAALLDG